MSTLAEKVAALEVEVREHDRKLVAVMAQTMSLQSAYSEGRGAARAAGRGIAIAYALAGAVLTTANIVLTVVLR